MIMNIRTNVNLERLHVWGGNSKVIYKNTHFHGFGFFSHYRKNSYLWNEGQVFHFQGYTAFKFLIMSSH